MKRPHAKGTLRKKFTYFMESFSKNKMELSVSLTVISPMGNIKKFSFSSTQNLSGNICSNTNPNKLVQCGDIESNPGPTPKNTKASGRPKTVKKSFPSKFEKVFVPYNQNLEPSPSTSNIIRSTPIGL